MVTVSDPSLAIDPRTGPGIDYVKPAGLRQRLGGLFRTGSTAHEKRAFFTERWVGIALIVPQLVLIFTFFYWPAGEALYWAFTLERPWGGGNAWVGFSNFAAMLGDPVYWNSIVRSLVFALASSG